MTTDKAASLVLCRMCGGPIYAGQLYVDMRPGRAHIDGECDRWTKAERDAAVAIIASTQDNTDCPT